MVDTKKRRVTDSEAGSLEEIEYAINDLSIADLNRLKKAAGHYIGLLGSIFHGQTEEDLVHAAITATLEGKRRWNKTKASFIIHLIGVIRSITSHYRESFKDIQFVQESSLVGAFAQGEGQEVLLHRDFDVEKNMIFKEKLEEIEKTFSGNDVELLIIDGWREGMTAKEIQDALDISPNKYEASVKQIRRTVRKKEGKNV